MQSKSTKSLYTIRALKEEYINPFGEDLDKESFFNLSSGIQVDTELARIILGTTCATKNLLRI